MSNILSLLYAPLFIILLYNFDFKTVVLAYLCFAVLFFIYRYIKRERLKDLLLPSFYLVALSSAYFFASFDIVKLIPVAISAVFFVMFVDSYMNKKEFIYESTVRFYPKKLEDWEVKYLKKGDGYWAVVTFINTTIQVFVVIYGNDLVWAFYTSVGWYIFFFVSLASQIIYGKVYAYKLYS